MSAPISGPADSAAARAFIDFVAITTNSTGPTSDGSVVASIRTTRSPLAPSTRSPRARIASTCAVSTSMAETSWPAAASRPA